ncbi:MAG: tetratricopeptide repeat protein [Pseudomonadota bacterium]|nr:tetratricopeptide repeat protein [Pseudomonadota bacterium]
MRSHILALLLLGCAVPALAQTQPVEKRVNKLEQEMRAVQRKVFPGGAGAIVEPEIRPQPSAAPGGLPAGSAVSDLSARVDALEAQLATLTGQIEQSGFRVRQLEETLNRFRSEAEARLASMEKGAPAPAVTAAAEVQEPAAEPSQPAGAAPAQDKPTASAAGDPAEEAYNRGFRLWEKEDYAGAQAALEAMAKKYPNHPKASWARNLAGRAYLDEGKPATAAKILLGNYQTDPKGERAADSLLFLGQALMKLGKAAEACQVYDELRDVYGASLRDVVKQRLPKARSEAKCSS